MQSATESPEKQERQISIPVPDIHLVRRWAAYLALFALSVYVVYLVREIWLPIGLAFLLATVLDPVVDRLEARGFSRLAGTATIFGSFILLVAGGLFLLIPPMTDQVGHLQVSFGKYFPDTSPAGLKTAFSKMHVPDAISKVSIVALQGVAGGYEKTSSWLTEYGMRFISNLVWVVIVPIVAFYALLDYHLILGKGLLLVPPAKRQGVQTYVAEVTGIFGKYLRGLMIVSVLNGVATYLLLLALRVPNSLLLGVIAGVLYSVPYIGALLTIVLTAGVAFTSGGPSAAFTAVGLSFVLHQVIFDQIITPRVVGRQVGLHPIFAIIALLAGNLLLGIIGMILAVPIAACIQIGVLTLVPKLGHDLEFEHPSEVAAEEATVMTPEEAKRSQIENPATRDLHATIAEAVNRIEEKIAEEDETPIEEPPQDLANLPNIQTS